MNDPNSGSRPWWDGDYVWRPKDAGESPHASAPEPIEIEPEPVLAQCWRCGQAVEQSLERCTHCRAGLTPVRPGGRSARPSLPDEDDEEPRREVSRGGSAGLLPLVWFFIALLSVSLFQGLFAHSHPQEPGEAALKKQMALVLVVEAIDTALVLIAVAAIARPKRLRDISGEQAAGAWGLAVPVLAGLLLANVAYHRLLNDYLQLPVEDNLTGGQGLSLLILIVVCVQPAIVEELFFRYLALGTLRRHMGMHAAVVVSSVMFGMAHIGAPLSIPLLTVLGMGFGYMRVVSGSLLLPMVMHFIHNLVVILMVVKS